MRRIWLPFLALALLGAGADWQADVVGRYVGREWNAGVMACARTEFAMHGDRLVGHYWIDDAEPFEGDLTSFIPDGVHSGSFVWTDRYGRGALTIHFAEDGGSFSTLWGGALPDPAHPGFGLREPGAQVPGCTASPTS